ncbi:MAG: hypothetical protein QNJ26_08000 [Desulfobacterales bacterium]|nr:hypothetical protein [Desulfobacterales bacterium]
MFRMSFKWYRRVVASAMVLMLSFSVAAYAQKKVQNKTFVVVGTSVIQGGNIQAAREAAISEGLVAAVALMTKEVLEVNSLIEYFPEVNQIIFAKPNAFVLDYKVLTETESDKNYRVLVKARVAGKKIAKQLSNADILRTKVDLPAILFFISEQNLQEDAPRYWWGKQMGGFEAISEETMADILKTRGFPIVNHRGVGIGKTTGLGDGLTPVLTDEAAINIGTRLQADLIIMGSSVASPTASIMGDDLKSFKAILQARVLRTQNGEELLNISRTSVTANINEAVGGREALTMVATLAGDDLATQLDAAWRRLAERPSQVEVFVEGTGNLAHFVKFRRALSSVSGVEGIRVKEIKPNETTLIVDYKGKAEELAEALMRQNFENFGINIYEISNQNLKITLVSG